MDKILKKAILIALLSFTFFHTSQAQFTAVQSGSWNDGATWGNTSPGVVGTDYPGAVDDVIIPSNAAVFTVAVTGTEICNSLTIGSSPSIVNGHAELEVSLGGELTVTTDLTMPQITTATTNFILDVNAGTVNVNGNIICTTVTAPNRNSKDSKITIDSGTLTVDGDVTFAEITTSARQYIEFVGDGRFNLGGSITANVNALILNGNSTVDFTGTGHNIPFDNFDNIIISGTGTYTNGSGEIFDIEESLTISGSARLDLNGLDMIIGGDLNCSSSDSDPLIEGTQTITFDKNRSSIINHTISGGNTLTFAKVIIGENNNGTEITLTSGNISIDSLTFSNTHRTELFIIDEATATATITTTVIRNNRASSANELIVNSGTLNATNIIMLPGASADADCEFEVNGGTANISGDIIMQGDIDNNFIRMTGASTLLNVSGSITGGRFNNTSTGTSLLTMNGVGTHTIGGAGGFLGGTTYDLPNFEVDGPILSLGADIIVEGNLTLTSGSLDVSTSNFEISLEGDWTNSIGTAAFIEQNGTVTFEGGQAQNILTDETFFNLSATGASTNLTISTNDPSITATTTSIESAAIFTVGSTGVLNTITLNQSSTNNSQITGSGQVSTTTTTLTEGAEIDYDGAAFTAADLNLDATGGVYTVAFNANGAGITIVNLTISGYNADYIHTAATGSISGLTTINASTEASLVNSVTINGGILSLNNIKMEDAAAPANNLDARLIINDGNADVNGDIEMEGLADQVYVDMRGTGVISCEGDIIGGDIKVNGGTGSIIMDNTGVQQLGGIGGAVTLGGTGYEISSLVVSNGSNTSLGTDLGITGSGDLTITGVGTTLDVTATPYAINLTGDWTNDVGAAGFIEQTGTVTFDGGQVQNILTNETFNNLAATGGSTDLTISTNDPTITATQISIESSSIFTVGSNAVLNTTTLNQSSTNNSQITGSGQVNTTTTNLTTGAEIDYAGGVFTATDLNLDATGGNYTVQFNANGSGVLLTNLTISGANADYLHNTGTGEITGTATVNVPDSTGINSIDVEGGTLILNDVILGTSGILFPSNTKDCRLIIGNGDADVNGNIEMRDSASISYVSFTGTGNLNSSGDIEGGDIRTNGSASGALHMDGAGAQTLAGDRSGALFANVPYEVPGLVIENTSATIIEASVQTEDFNITSNGTFDNNNKTLSVRGDFTINGAITDPFIENVGTVNFNGVASSTLQTIDNQNETSMTFYRIRINCRSNLAIDLETNNDIITGIYDHDKGTMTLLDHDFTLIGASGQTSNLNVGSLITSGPNSTFDYTDPTLQHTLIFDGYDDTLTLTQVYFIGDATNGIPVTGTDVGNVNFNGADIYGDVSFTRNKSTISSSGTGGMIYRNKVLFEVKPLSDRWLLAGTDPDIYMDSLTVLHHGISAFLLGRGSIGNEYRGKVYLETTSASIYVGRASSGNSTNTFFDDLEVLAASSGNVYLSNGDASNTSTVTFDGGDILCTSDATSTGGISFGDDADNFSTVTLQNGAKFNTPSGSILGSTSIYINNVDQTDASVTNTIVLDGTAKLTLGQEGTSATANNWSGSLIASAPRIRSMYYNNFSGSTYSFTKTGATNDNGSTINSYNGFNTFAVGSSTTFTNSGSSRWRLGVVGGNDYNGSVTFNSATNDMFPCYSDTSTFSGDISTVGSARTVVFASGVGGLMHIDGTGTMTLDGDDAEPPVVDQLLINGVGANLDLEVDFIVQSGGSSTFTNGIITTDATDMLQFEDQTVTTNIGSQASYIDGPAQWSVKNNSANYNLKFPIGNDGEWRAAELDIEHTNAGTGIYTAEMNLTSARALGYTFADATIDLVSSIRYWDITKSGSPTINTASVTLFYDTLANNDFAPDPTNLRVAKTDGLGTEWFDMGGTGSAADVGSITSSVNFTTFSKFTLADAIGGTNTLPIELISFNALENKQRVDLSWTTASEFENEYYEIERSSDGENFNPILKVNSKNNGEEFINYTDTDNNPLLGVSYYRLKYTDLHGKNKYSHIVPVTIFDDNKVLSIYPNPAPEGANVQLKINELSTENINIELTDITGKLIYSLNDLNNNNGLVSFPLDYTIPSGTYFITVSSQLQVYRSKLIVN